MARATIYKQVKEIIKSRILTGDCVVRGLPGERKLAEEAGVSYMTARKAVTELIDEQVLARRPNGSLIVHPEYIAAHAAAQVVLLVPAYPSPHFARLRSAIERIMQAQNVRLKAVEYSYWYDSIIQDAVHGADGLIVIPSTEPMPRHIIDSFSQFEPSSTNGKQARAKVIFFDADMTALGIPSVRLYGSEHFERVFDHLRDRGHRRINCLNTQGRNGEIDQRIDVWKAWLGTAGCDGELWDRPVEPYGDAMVTAHEAMHDLMDEHGPALGAIVCTTYPAAMGAIRACHDRGVPVGAAGQTGADSGVAICSMNVEYPGRYGTPSITGLEMPDLEPLLAEAIGWFKSAQTPWEGDLLITPDQPRLFLGESTGVRP